MSYLFLLLLLLLLLILLSIYLWCNCKNKFKNIDQEITVLNNQKEYDLYINLDKYRIGDVYYNNIGSNIKDYHIDKFPNSIAAEYVLKNKEQKRSSNIKLLLEIIKNKSNSSIKHNKCIIHLRIGDILDYPGFYNDKSSECKNYINFKCSSFKKCECNNIDNKYPSNYFQNLLNYLYNDIKVNNHYEKYIYPLSYYKQKIKKLKKLNINNVIIIAGAHIKCNNYKHSTYYINAVKKLFEDNDIFVELRLAKNPDDDVILVHNNKYFMPGMGGYSRLLKEVAENSDNIII